MNCKFLNLVLGLVLVDFVLSLFRTDEGTFVPKRILEKL